MLKKFTLVCLILSVFAGAAYAQGVPKKLADPAAKYSARDYYTQLKKVKNMDKTADFKTLRYAYTKTNKYKPYKLPSYKKMRTAYRAKKYKQAIQHADGIIKKDFLDAEAHMVNALAYKNLGKKEKSAYHNFIARGLLLSLLQKKGSGSSFKNPITVINIKEEYVVIDVLGYRGMDKRLMARDGHIYDVWKVKHPKTGKQGVMFFNVTMPISTQKDKLKVLKKTPPKKK